MNRKERRALPKEVQRATKDINNLTASQARIANLVADERGRVIANEYINNFEVLIDRNMSAALIEYGIDYNDIEGIQKNMSELLTEDSKKTKKLQGGNINMADLENKVLEEVKKLLENEVSKKESIEKLRDKFPKLSKSMLLNAYVKVKKEMGLTENRISKEVVYAEFDRCAVRLEGSEMVTNVMKKFDFTESTAKTYYSKWKKDYMPAKKVIDPLVSTIEKTTTEELQANAAMIIEIAKERQCSETVATAINKEEVKEVKGLKVLKSEEKVIKTVKVEGENGIYTANTNTGIILTRDNMHIIFNNPQELKEWVAEVEQVFEMVI